MSDVEEMFAGWVTRASDVADVKTQVARRHVQRILQEAGVAKRDCIGMIVSPVAVTFQVVVRVNGKIVRGEDNVAKTELLTAVIR